MDDKISKPKLELYVLWSQKHNRWWGPNAAGYVDELRDAGVYSLDDAIEHVENSKQSPNEHEHTGMRQVNDACEQFGYPPQAQINTVGMLAWLGML